MIMHVIGDIAGAAIAAGGVAFLVLALVALAKYVRRP